MRPAWVILYSFLVVSASSAQDLSLQGDDGQDRWGDHLRLEQGEIRSIDNSPVVYPSMQNSDSDVRIISEKGHVYFNEHGDRAGDIVDSVQEKKSAQSMPRADHNFWVV